jgi:8-oxo-dGTP pyrophosphatase MutT (NUDIX family)
VTDRHALPVAVHVLLLRDGEVLLLLRANTGYEDGNYSVIAGHVEPGEHIVETAVRESREEAGITIAPDDVRVCGVMHRRAAGERIDFFVAVRRWRGEICNAEPEKCAGLRWSPVSALPSNVVPYVRRAIELGCCQGIWFDAFGW